MIRIAVLLMAGLALSACATSSDQLPSGHATVQCTAHGDGSVTSCVVVAESPEGRGLGQEAVRVVQRGKLSDGTASVVGSAGRTFQTTVRFGDQAR